MTPRQIASLIGIVVLCFSVWKIQDWRYSSKIAGMEKQAAESTTIAVKAAMDKMQVDQKRKDDALAESNKRAQQNSLAASNALNAADGLRRELAAARADLSTATQQARDNYSAALETLLGECVRDYQEISEKADGHANDVKTLLDAWPN